MTMISLVGLGENLSDYGYDFTDQEAVQNTLNYLKRKMGYFSAWNFKEMQIKIKRYANKSPEIQPFLSYVMDTLMVNDRKYSVPVSWDDLQVFTPQVEIPEKLDDELLQITI